jgi:hypothetical protein
VTCSGGDVVFSTNKTDRHGIIEIFLKAVLNTITLLTLNTCSTVDIRLSIKLTRFY